MNNKTITIFAIVAGVLVLCGGTFFIIVGLFMYSGNQAIEKANLVHEKSLLTIQENNPTPNENADYNSYILKGGVNNNKLTKIIGPTLKLTSGKVIISDPYYATETFTFPFNKTLSTSNYPISFYVTGDDSNTWGTRVAFAVLETSDNEPVKWEKAQVESDDPYAQDIGVDSGMLSFMDHNIANTFIKEMNDYDAKGNNYDLYDLLSTGFAKNTYWSEYIPTSINKENVVVFSSGIGDGSYYAYWGIDKDGNVCKLLVDLQLFDSLGSNLE